MPLLPLVVFLANYKRLVFYLLRDRMEAKKRAFPIIIFEQKKNSEFSPHFVFAAAFPLLLSHKAWEDEMNR